MLSRMTELSQTDGVRRRISLTVELEHFRIPPVHSALVLGRKAPIGPNAMEKALHEMMPENFERIDVEHASIQSLFVRQSHLRIVPREKLVEILLSHAEGILDAGEMLHVSIDLSLKASEEFEI